MLDNNIYERFIEACNCASIIGRDLTTQLFVRPDDAFNYILKWSCTKEGWNYWANVSVLWKKRCLAVGLAKYVKWFELSGYHWEWIDVKNYD